MLTWYFRGKLSDQQRNEQPKILEDAKEILKRYGWSPNPKNENQATNGDAAGAQQTARASSKPDKLRTPNDGASDKVCEKALKPEQPEGDVKKAEGRIRPTTCGRSKAGG